MKLSDYVIDFLVAHKIPYVFEICGGAIAHLLDSLYGRKDIKTVSMHHEQAAAVAAEGYSRSTGNIGVAMATSGPGATNLMTGIASCFFDSIPCLFLTGQVNTYEYKFNKGIRQLGFQETEIVKMVKPIAKEAILIRKPEKIRYYLEKLFFLAQSGRPGPVLLDIPMNIQRVDINPKSLESFYKSSISESFTAINKKIVKQVLTLIDASHRPIVLVGGGLRLSKAESELFQFIRKTGIPVVTSLMGRDAFPNNHPSFAGMIGSYGNRYANLAIANADFILALGTRLDTRQTGTRPETFARGAKIVHVDIDPKELNYKVKVDVPIHADARLFLKTINNYMIGYKKDKIQSWKTAIKGYQEKYPSYDTSLGEKIDPNLFMHMLSRYIPEDALICVDVGQNQMWAAQTLQIKRAQRFLTQGGMGAMGSALPLAIGASFARKGKIVVLITGDGGFQLNIQELQTIYHYQLPVKIILLNNSCYGMVRQFQEQYFNSRFQSTVIGYNAPDFQQVVSAYKVPVNKIVKKSQITKALKILFKDKKPIFLEVKIRRDAKVLPKLLVNRPVEEQDPPLSKDKLKSNMFVDLLQDESNEVRKNS